MAWLTVDINGNEEVFEEKPERARGCWMYETTIEGEWVEISVELPKGSIKRLIGRELKWEDEPVYLDKELIKYNEHNRGIWLAVQELIVRGYRDLAQEILVSSGMTKEECEEQQEISGSFNEEMYHFINRTYEE